MVLFVAIRETSVLSTYSSMAVSHFPKSALLALIGIIVAVTSDPPPQQRPGFTPGISLPGPSSIVTRTRVQTFSSSGDSLPISPASSGRLLSSVQQIPAGGVQYHYSSSSSGGTDSDLLGSIGQQPGGGSYTIRRTIRNYTSSGGINFPDLPQFPSGSQHVTTIRNYSSPGVSQHSSGGSTFFPAPPNPSYVVTRKTIIIRKKKIIRKIIRNGRQEEVEEDVDDNDDGGLDGLATNITKHIRIFNRTTHHQQQGGGQYGFSGGQYGGFPGGGTNYTYRLFNFTRGWSPGNRTYWRHGQREGDSGGGAYGQQSWSHGSRYNFSGSEYPSWDDGNFNWTGGQSQHSWDGGDQKDLHSQVLMQEENHAHNVNKRRPIVTPLKPPGKGVQVEEPGIKFVPTTSSTPEATKTTLAPETTTITTTTTTTRAPFSEFSGEFDSHEYPEEGDTRRIPVSSEAPEATTTTAPSSTASTTTTTTTTKDPLWEFDSNESSEEGDVEGVGIIPESSEEVEMVNPTGEKPVKPERMENEGGETAPMTAFQKATLVFLWVALAIFSGCMLLFAYYLLRRMKMLPSCCRPKGLNANQHRKLSQDAELQRIIPPQAPEYLRSYSETSSTMADGNKTMNMLRTTGSALTLLGIPLAKIPEDQHHPGLAVKSDKASLFPHQSSNQNTGYARSISCNVPMMDLQQSQNLQQSAAADYHKEMVVDGSKNKSASVTLIQVEKQQIIPALHSTNMAKRLITSSHRSLQAPASSESLVAKTIVSSTTTLAQSPMSSMLVQQSGGISKDQLGSNCKISMGENTDRMTNVSITKSNVLDFGPYGRDSKMAMMASSNAGGGGLSAEGGNNAFGSSSVIVTKRVIKAQVEDEDLPTEIKLMEEMDDYFKYIDED